jgi:hypothetical protein
MYANKRTSDVVNFTAATRCQTVLSNAQRCRFVVFIHNSLRAFLVSRGFAHARGIGPHGKIHAADHTQFEFQLFLGVA